MFPTVFPPFREHAFFATAFLVYGNFTNRSQHRTSQYSNSVVCAFRPRVCDWLARLCSVSTLALRLGLCALALRAFLAQPVKRISRWLLALRLGPVACDCSSLCSPSAGESPWMSRWADLKSPKGSHCNLNSGRQDLGAGRPKHLLPRPS